MSDNCGVSRYPLFSSAIISVCPAPNPRGGKYGVDLIRPEFDKDSNVFVEFLTQIFMGIIFLYRYIQIFVRIVFFIRIYSDLCLYRNQFEYHTLNETPPCSPPS